jgi:hypothetical protein
VKRWADMSPRQRDGLVAEKVMGWNRDDVWLGDYEWLFNTDVPRYTTDISAAWEVVEKIRTRFYVDIELSEPTLGVTVGLSNMDGEVACVTCATAPEAICKAALTAVGVDVE